jgi:predicted DNA-binding transcriptional regulator YafY
MRVNRFFEIVYLLMEKKTITAKELAAHFEVSTRTILRDIDAMSTAGIPIYTAQGKGGGISLLDNFVLNKALFSDEEQNQILFALQSMSATQHVEVDGVLGRLQSLFAKPDADWIEVDFSRWGESENEKAKFAILKNAVINAQALSFAYASSYGKTATRKAYPLKLLFKAKSWYLQAFCLTKNDYRTFKVNRMRDIATLPRTFEAKEFKIPSLEAFAYETPYLVNVELLFAPQAAYRVYDEFEGQVLKKNADGSFSISLSLPNDHWLYSFIMSFGALVEVLEPRHVREEIARQAERIKKIYQNTP